MSTELLINFQSSLDFGRNGMYRMLSQRLTAQDGVYGWRPCKIWLPIDVVIFNLVCLNERLKVWAPQNDCTQWLGRELTDRTVRSSNSVQASRLVLSRLGQCGSASALVLSLGGMVARHRKGGINEGANLLTGQSVVRTQSKHLDWFCLDLGNAAVPRPSSFLWVAWETLSRTSWWVKSPRMRRMKFTHDLLRSRTDVSRRWIFSLN
ncbi:hypothetical protein T265_06020 [Opisthorchis viverrini]|uniref:Uncharacterized protein n=1 Tax=Opisthorchis viverrini TaxID=6198 RepID=A0A074ZHQ6_OPIVI|nr:hypothetical protein T265_06020 [Opisthorchis viverrini]KER26808.1 hypothetical protein T265_06020 [Opisthorchis viverrini]